MTAWPLSPRVLVVGAGPAGLRAAADLATRVDGDVVVIEREAEAGGIPRHSDHLGYGVRDLGRVTTGPAYARTLVSRARDAGARIVTSTMVTGWAGDRTVDVTGPDGRQRVEADVVILATGARERPRPARLIPGARCEGVYTTGQLQNLVHLKHREVGRRAVVVGAELVSWSAVMTLREAGCATELLVSAHAHPESYAAVTAVGRALSRTPVVRRARVARILGDARVTGVELEHLDTGRRRVVPCDTVVVTGDWVPDNELARAAGIPLDPGSRAPVVDSALRTPLPGVFAIGNLLHPVDTADVAALDGAAVVPYVLDQLAGRLSAARHLELAVEPPFRWVSPARVDLAHPQPPRGRLLLWTDELRLAPVVHVRQGGRVVARRRLPWPAAPGRVLRVPSSLLAGLDPAAGTVTLALD